MKPFVIFRHAFQMVQRILRSYAMLSVTIVLSFSFLLGYMAFMDAQLYNRYKEVFAMRRGDVRVQIDMSESDRVQLLQEKLEEMDDTISYAYYEGGLGSLDAAFTVEGQELLYNGYASLQNWGLILVPDYAWQAANTASIDAGGVVWVDGREEFTLAEDECLINEQLFYALELNREEYPVYTFWFPTAGWGATLRVVGYIESSARMSINEYGSVEYNGNMRNTLVLSTKNWSADAFPDGTFYAYVVIHSPQPEAAAALASQMGFRLDSVPYSIQNAALENIRTQKQTKALITCALLLLLGINLYSSFSNALNERKFEIGVKRAIGASSWSIVRQFLYEGLIVMLANILLSVALVTDALIVYKYIYEHTPDEWGQFYDWVLYISPYTVLMFGICAVSLTVVFSLIFAYKSTQVEIVRYLKAE